MSFPFSISYNKHLKAVITAGNQQQLMQYIQKRILEDKADNIVIGYHSVSYKGSTSNRRGSLYRSVDSGLFTLMNNDGTWYLNYEIYTKAYSKVLQSYPL
ncbi:hypothetical protein [Mucilaginibacter sp. PAMB04168]|uniref:hypothetical protein n=1 Tax=Mucilaginibacter sp. PAMB04168 TaxID=3138567 RepID=UPI0031F632F9